MSSLPAVSDKAASWLFLGILLLATMLRLPGLEQVPPPLNQDEASRGYDAWALLETGADRHGRRWPLFLESFGPGDYTGALTTYITLPFVAVLGPTVTAMRLPDAALGVFTVAILYLLLRRKANTTVALLAAAILATDPWHIALSRTAHESGFTPFFLALAILGLHRAGMMPAANGASTEDEPTSRRAAIWAVVAGLALGAHAWAYPATRLFTPLFCLAVVLVFRSRYRTMFATPSTRSTLIAAGAGLLLGAAPLLATAVTHPEFLAARARITLLVHEDLTTAEALRQFAANFMSNLDPRYLFLQCDEMSGASIPKVGLHLSVTAPLALIGIVCLLATWRQCPWRRLLLIWGLLYPIPAAICADWNPHPMRSAGGILLFPIVSALGGAWLLDMAARHLSRWRRPAATLALVAVGANLAHLAEVYYREFPLQARPGYQTALVDAIQCAAKHSRGADFILVTNYSNQPYIYSLLYHPIPPKALRRADKVVVDGRLGFHQVLRIGQYFFPPRDDTDEAVRRFRETWASLPRRAHGILIFCKDREDASPPGEVITTLGRFPVGDPRAGGQVLEVHRWRPPEDPN